MYPSVVEPEKTNSGGDLHHEDNADSNVPPVSHSSWQSDQSFDSTTPQSSLLSTPAAPTPVAGGLLEPSQNDQPVAVVQALSVRGVEYAMMTLTLWFAAGALAGLLLSLFNGGTSFAVLAFPLALLLVCLPIFSFFFIRLKRAEVANPALRFDPSKRRLTQFTQVIAFAACLFNLIGFIYIALQKIGGETSASLGKSFLNLLVVLVVAGGILAYYWFDEHRSAKR